MATCSGDERDWAADKRDFVADRRDELADQRDDDADQMETVADTRQATMDAREAALDERERQLDERADSLGYSTDDADRSDAAAHRSDERVIRDQERLEREKSRVRRDLATAARDEATEQRHEITPSTKLAMAFAEIDRQLYSADTFDAVLLRIAETAVCTVTGCDMASVTLNEHSVGTGGSLNAYGSEPNAFSDEAQQIGLILAAHASVAAGTVHERRQLENLADNLTTALWSRDVIGQAKGILMERLKLTPEDAFDALRHSSQRLNEKLRAVAFRVAETGEFDTKDLSQD